MDVNICAFRNPEREAYSLFAEPRMGQNRIAVFVRKDRAPRMTNDPEWKGLAGMRTGLVLGVSMGAKFDEFLEANTRIERVAHIGLAMKMLARDRLDVVPFGDSRMSDAGDEKNRRVDFTAALPRPGRDDGALDNKFLLADKAGTIRARLRISTNALAATPRSGCVIGAK